jgi:predicted GNAT family N-acyltransferase
MIVYTTASTNEELNQILKLQRENLPVALSEEIKKAEGFVTVEHSFDLLKRINTACPHIIAKDGDSVVGYALSMHPNFAKEIEVLLPMFEQISRVINNPATVLGVTSDNFIVMGQICIHKDYRKQGIFRKLYQTQLKEIAPGFTKLITEVDKKNPRSMQAHYAIGFKTLSKYSSEGKDWELIVLS